MQLTSEVVKKGLFCSLCMCCCCIEKALQCVGDVRQKDMHNPLFNMSAETSNYLRAMLHPPIGSASRCSATL